MSSAAKCEGDLEGPTPGVSRRSFVAGSALVVAPAIASVSVGATESGYVEVEVDATLPSGTSASVRAFEDLDGDGNWDNTQEKDLSDGVETYEYDALSGFQGQAIHYWFEIELESDEDREETPEIDSLTVTLPEDDSDPDPDDDDTVATPRDGGVFDLWDNFLAFTTMFIFGVGALGLAARSLTVASFGAFLTFTYIAVETGHPLLTNILYVSLALVFIGMGFKLWRLEGSGEV